MSVTGSWGRRVPLELEDRIASTWGARAIYTGQQIDLLPDRQSWWPSGDEHKKVRAPLIAWVNAKGLPYLRKQAKRLFPDESRVVALDDGRFHIEASPQASYGYLYIRAWELHEQAPANSHTHALGA